MRKLSVWILVLSVWLLVACGAQPVVSNFDVRPAAFSPNGDGKEDAAEVVYTLSTSAYVTLTLTSADGKNYTLRRNQPRSSGDYRFLLGGVMDGVVLANGVYALRLEAKPADGPLVVEQKTVTVTNATLVLPELQNFTVAPKQFTPNRDGIDDRVTISYNLTKKADVFVYLLGKDGKKYPVAERTDNVVKPGEPGVHNYDYEGGVDLGAPPPPDGVYQVIAEADDPTLGTRVTVSDTLTVAEGGVPRAQIVGNTARWSSTSVLIGRTLAFTATIENNGTVPIRTKGPFYGTTYDNDSNHNTLNEPEEPGVFRVGVDFEGNSSGRSYPYRWALGKESDLRVKEIGGKKYYYLDPGKRIIVTGAIKMADRKLFNLTTPYFWVGLLHEQVRIVNDRVEPKRINIGF